MQHKPRVKTVDPGDPNKNTSSGRQSSADAKESGPVRLLLITMYHVTTARFLSAAKRDQYISAARRRDPCNGTRTLPTLILWNSQWTTTARIRQACPQVADSASRVDVLWSRYRGWYASFDVINILNRDYVDVVLWIYSLAALSREDKNQR